MRRIQFAISQKSNRTKLVQVLLLSGLCFLPGCFTFSTYTACPTRPIDVEPTCSTVFRRACEDYNNYKLGEECLEEMEDRCGKAYSDDFHSGFLRAFYDLSQGQKGILPPVPPARYWKQEYRCPQGACQVNSWYAGYKSGVYKAHLVGVTQCARVRCREDYLACRSCPNCPSTQRTFPRQYRSTVIYHSLKTRQPETKSITPIAPPAPTESKEQPEQSIEEAPQSAAQPDEVSMIPIAPPVPEPIAQSKSQSDVSDLLGADTEMADFSLFDEMEKNQPTPKEDAPAFGHSFHRSNQTQLTIPEFGHAFTKSIQ